MKLDDLTFVARPRRPWESVDLGLRMARTWRWPLLRAWLLLALPFLALLWLLPVPDAWVPWMLWWFKPLFERPPLFVLSRAVFGVRPERRELLRLLPRLLGSQWFASLTWRRFSPTRSYDLPLVLLENLDGAARRRRLTQLHREQAGAATWLTLIGLPLEILLALSTLALFGFLLPELQGAAWISQLGASDKLVHVLVLMALALVAPFYVAGGFALYLNRRIHLEGWDIELVFRGLAARQRRAPASVLGAVLLLVIVGGSVLPPQAGASLPPGHPSIAPAQELSQSSDPLPRLPAAAEASLPSPRESRQLVRQILSSEELEQRQVTRYPRFLLEWTLEPDEAPSAQPLWLMEAVRLLARGVEWLAWVMVAALLVLVALRFRSWHQRFQKRARPRVSPPAQEVLFGLDLRQSALPERLTAEARRTWSQGNARAAVALLYRGALSHLQGRGFIFHSGFTEQDCLSQVQAQGEGALGGYFAGLTEVWQQLAYGHQGPDERQFSVLCNDWDRYFGASEGTPKAAGEVSP